MQLKDKEQEQAARKPLRAAIYCRVSTDEQEENTSLDTQESDCRAYAEKNGYVIVCVFRETFTGALYRERKKLSAIRELIRGHKIDVVVIRTFDRLSRNHTHFAVLVDEMQHYSVELACVKEQVDNSPLGMMLRVIMSAVAEIEHTKIYERTQEGRRRAVTDRGHIVATYKPLYGYAWDDPTPKKRYSVHINEEEAKIVRRIIRSVADGVPVREIARQLREEGVPPPKSHWQTVTIRDMVHDERYIGKGAAFMQHGAHARNPHTPIPFAEGIYPPITDEATHDRARRRLAINKQEAARHNPNPEQFLLRAGFVYCDICKRRMHVHRVRDYSYYECKGRSDVDTGPICPMQTVPTEKLDALVWEDIAHLARETYRIREAVQKVLEGTSMKPEKDALKLTRERLETDKNRYTNDLKNPNCYGSARDTVLALLSETEEKLNRLDLEEATIEAGEIDLARVRAELQKILAWCERMEKGEKQATYEEKRAFMHLIGARVYVKKTERKRDEPIAFTVRITLPELAPLLSGRGESNIEDAMCSPTSRARN